MCTPSACWLCSDSVQRAARNSPHLVPYTAIAGEYFVDKKTSKIYWIPPLSTVASGAIEGYVSMLPTVISATNVTDLTFSGIAFMHARGNGVDIVDSQRVLVSLPHSRHHPRCYNHRALALLSCWRFAQLDDCVVANHGNLAVNMTNSTDSTIRGASISQTGDGGIWLEGGHRDTLTPSNLTVENSRMRSYNRWDRTYRPGPPSWVHCTHLSRSDEF